MWFFLDVIFRCWSISLSYTLLYITCISAASWLQTVGTAGVQLRYRCHAVLPVISKLLSNGCALRLHVLAFVDIGGPTVWLFKHLIRGSQNHFPIKPNLTFFMRIFINWFSYWFIPEWTQSTGNTLVRNIIIIITYYSIPLVKYRKYL